MHSNPAKLFYNQKSTEIYSDAATVYFYKTPSASGRFCKSVQFLDLCKAVIQYSEHFFPL